MKFVEGKDWRIYNGDCVELTQQLEAESVDYSIFSPPFESLYVYSDDPRDMSNCKNSETFWKHFSFLIKELYRITRNGRLVTVHCNQLPTSKMVHGVIGLRDFRGEIIRAFQAVGFIYHSEVCIRKDPVIAMQRTKAIGLLHKQVKKDSTMSRQGIADYMVNVCKASYLVTARKPGENTNPVKGRLAHYYGEELDEEFKRSATTRVRERGRDEHISIEIWQRYAEAVWMDIAMGDTLSAKFARELEDERHIAPLQLTPIRRCIQLWTNKGDTVFSPFAGIGSELFVAVEMGRKALGVELKPSYFQQAVANLKRGSDVKLFADRVA